MKTLIGTMLTLALLIVLLALLTGCEESNQRTLWGQGELPTDWQETFGADNGARLDFVQTQKINTQVQAMQELLKRVQALELENPAELAERVRKLEDATQSGIESENNQCQHPGIEAFRPTDEASGCYRYGYGPQAEKEEKMTIYKQIIKNQPIVLKYRRVRGKKVANMDFACCDCGLVHNIALVPLKTRLKTYFWRDNRRTANHRQGKKK